MTPEGKIEAYLKKRVLASGGRIRKLSWPGHRGAPDRMIWWRCAESILGPIFADSVLAEVKAPGEKPTKQQQREHKKLRDDGWEVWVVDSKEKIDALLKEHGW